MVAYAYSPETTEYVGTVERQVDPLGGGYLMPANATQEEPPSPGEGEVALYGTRWTLVTDQRGEEYWNKATMGIYLNKEIEFTPPSGLTDIEPPTPPTELHIVQWNGVDDWEILSPTLQEVENAARKAARLSGVELNIKDSEGDVRWRIVPNPEGKLQVEVDPIDEPHVGEWLLNGILGIPHLAEGELVICLDGTLKGISVLALKELIDNAE